VFGGSVAPNSQGIVEEVVNGGFRQLVFTSFVSETQVVIAEEDLSMTLSVPVWSSDGSYIAYRRIMLIGLDVPGAAPPPSGVREGTVAVGSQVVVRGLDGTEIFSINSGAVPRAFSLQNTQLLVQKGTKFVLFNISDGAEREVNGTSKLISDSNFSVAVSLDSELLAVSGEGRIIWGLIDWGTATFNTLGNIASAADSMVFNSNDELLILHGGTLSAYALGEDGSMQKVGQSSSPGGENIQLLSWTL
jgi:hypothetical protein